MYSSIEVLATESSSYLAELIATGLEASHRHIVRRLFGGGERYYKVDITDARELAGRDAVFVASTHSDDDLLELYRVGCTLADLGTRRRIFVVPFFGYSTMERAGAPGEIVTAKHNVRLLSSIPDAGLGNIFLFLDLHKPGLIHYFEGSALRRELSAIALLGDALATMPLKNFVVASADLGTLGPLQALAGRFEAQVAFINKERDFEKTHVLSVVGDVRGKTVVIYDDMIRSGGSLIQAAEAYKARGATRVYAAVSHFALNDAAIVDLLQNSPLEGVISTNSHPMSQNKSVRGHFFQHVDVSGLFVEAVKDYLSQ